MKKSIYLLLFSVLLSASESGLQRLGGNCIAQYEPEKINNTLFFACHDGANSELWKSDGTVEGTIIVKDINPGSGLGMSSSPRELTAVGNTLFFYANDGTHGTELWKSDGSEDGTFMVKDIMDGASGSRIYSLITVGETLFFIAEDDTHGYELWKSNVNGTAMVKDIVSGGEGSHLNNMMAVGNRLFFNQDQNKLWRSEGTEESTIMLKEFDDNKFILQPFTVGNTLFFIINYSGQGIYELWKSDGTVESTVIVKSFPQGREAGLGLRLDIEGMLYFQVGNTTLWRSDGTEAGTVIETKFADGAIDYYYPTIINLS